MSRASRPMFPFVLPDASRALISLTSAALRRSSILAAGTRPSSSCRYIQGTNSRYPARVWMTLVPGKRWSANESRMPPMPSSSRVSFWANWSITPCIRRRWASE